MVFSGSPVGSFFEEPVQFRILLILGTLHETQHSTGNVTL
jgi:hypothetical protein